MTRHRHAVVLALFACACLEPPELDELPPIPTDLGGLDTWAPLDGPPATGAPLDDESGVPGAESTGAEMPAPDPGLVWLRLTEVLADPEGKDGGPDSPEFVEIKNTGSEPVNLSGLFVDAPSWPDLDGVDLGLTDVTLEAGAYLVISRWATDVDPTLADPRMVDGAYFVGFLDGDGLRNADGHVTLASSDGPIDELVYGVPALESPPSGDSMCRRDETSDPTDWSACSPTPGAPNFGAASPEPTALPPGAVQIIEVHANPPGSSSEEKSYEFIELLNISENEVELDRCTISDALDSGATGTDPLIYESGDGGCVSSTCLAPGARALIVGQGYLGPVGSALVLTTDDSTIADGGLTNTEPVVLWDATGAAVTSYRDWVDPAGPPLPDQELPLHRMDPTGPDHPSNWVSAPPSPGD